MNLYHVQDRDRPLFIEAEDFEAALERWRAVIREENDGDPGDEPDGVSLVCEDSEFWPNKIPECSFCDEIQFDDDELDEAVSSFAYLLRERLRAKELEGRRGWNDESWATSEILDRAVVKLQSSSGMAQPVDMIDAAAYAMFAWHRYRMIPDVELVEAAPDA